MVFNKKYFDSTCKAGLCCLLLILNNMAHSSFFSNEENKPFSAKVTVNVNNKKMVNPYLKGNNIQWFDRADELFDDSSMKFKSSLIDKVKKLDVSVLRYPGGSLSDLYHWQDGLGSQNNRKRNRRFHGDGDDQILVGTKEFLILCEVLNAEPLITVNLITGTAEEAAAWVKATNITRMYRDNEILPKVKFWEIGNEPYLVDDNQKSLAIKPEEFARRATKFIKAMKLVDPTIKVGIPLRSDKLAGVPATPLLGYNKIILQGVKTTIDFVSVHNAYYPFIFNNKPNDKDIYLSSMAASDIVKENFSQTRKELKQFRSEKDIPIALTEFNAMYTIGKGNSDKYISSLSGALYVADILMMLSKIDNVLMANYWSLSGNWYFGALDQNGQTRPTYHSLAGFNRVWKGNALETEIISPSFDSPSVGFAPKRKNISYINAISTIKDNIIHVMLINKNINSEANIELNFVGTSQFSLVQSQKLFSEDYFSTKDTSWSKFQSISKNTPIQFSMPPHSLMIIKVSK